MEIVENKYGFFKKIFSIFMAMYPLFCIYKGISSITVGDLLLIVFFFLTPLLDFSIKLDRRSVLIGVFTMYALLVLLLNLIISDIGVIYGTAALLLRMIKFAFYMICVLVTGSKFLDWNIFNKAMFICASAACIFLILQYVFFYGSGKIVLGQIPGLPLHLSEYSEIDYDRIFGYQFRPSSFFLEPALFVHYVIVALIIALFDKEISSRLLRVGLIILLTAGIIMSTSAQGILYIIVVYFLYAWKEIKNKAWMVGFILLFVFIALICYSRIDVLQEAVDRLLYNEKAAEARLGSYQYCFELNPLISLFGNGYGTTANGEYMAGAAYIWYGCGIVGLFMVLMLFAFSYIKANNTISKVICVVFLIMFFGTALFYNYMVFWYFSLIMTSSSLAPKSRDSDNNFTKITHFSSHNAQTNDSFNDHEGLSRRKGAL